MKNYRFNHNELLQSLGLPTSSNEDISEVAPSGHHHNHHIKNGQNHELLLCMTIDLGDGKKDVLNVHSNDDPKDLARQFCVKNHLNLEAVEILTNNIILNLNSRENEGQNENSAQNPEGGNMFDTFDFYKKLRHNEEVLGRKEKNKF